MIAGPGLIGGLRPAFVERFGEADADTIMDAARGHVESNEGDETPWADIVKILAGPPPGECGPDPFLWALAMCISWECLTTYRQDHDIQASANDLREWIKANVGKFPPEVRDPGGDFRYAEFERVQ